MSATSQSTSALSMESAQYTQVRHELARLRLLLRRRCLWLRHQWGRDAEGEARGLAIGNAQADRLLSGESRQEEAEFYRSSLEVRAVDRELALQQQRLHSGASAMKDAGTPPALDLLAAMFELTRFEREVVVLCLAAEVDASFPRLYAYLQDDAARPYATPQLAVELLTTNDEERRSAWLSLESSGRLRQFRLIAMPGGGALGVQPMRLAPRLLPFLLGVRRLDEQAEKLLEVIPRLPVPPGREERIDGVRLLLAARLAQGAWPRMNLHGPPEGGKRAMARAICDRLRLSLYRLDVEKAAADPEAIALLERESVLLQFGLYADMSGATAERLRALEWLLGRLRVLLIAGSEEPLRTEWPMLSVAVPAPTAVDREALWRQALDGVSHVAEHEIGSLVEAFDFGPSSIIAATWQARCEAGIEQPETGVVSAAHLWRACRLQAARGMEALAQPVVPCHNWDDIVLPVDVRRQLREIAAQVRNRHQVYTAWSFGGKLNRGRGISALFSGPSGTGKTMAAEILADDLSLDLYRVDLSSVVNKYIGETEKNLRRVFDAAERSGAILFFDEADALFGKRTSVQSAHDKYANQEVAYLLQRIEEYDGLLILASNFKNNIDDAFLRRFQSIIHFPMPNAA